MPSARISAKHTPPLHPTGIKRASTASRQKQLRRKERTPRQAALTTPRLHLVRRK